ncbi:hypothetical protein BDV26DRAFT_295609 [Aspergillus bertholletiae]|uniref:OTT1508-like deaminase n=1 Tax=Aspergillus bertholletiae TaxID=1226010 RepID=A0A5N7AYK0_9EURO|nr:hypothetical protein BDV26DRAFT_295609 [Aspergillus bertholletiae]
MANSIVYRQEKRHFEEFYRIVHLLGCMNVTRGDRIKGKKEGYTVAQFRRDTADALAYIAAYDKLPARVTAIALGREEGKLVVWITANENVQTEVVNFLTEVLSRLDNIANNPILEDEEEFLDFVLDFNHKGILKYYTSFYGAWKKFRHGPNGYKGQDLAPLDVWIQKTFPKNGQPGDMANLARKCHRARKEYPIVFELLKQNSSQNIMLSRDDEHKREQLHKLLYKIGRLVTECQKLIKARNSLQEDFGQGAVVKRIDDIPPTHTGLRQKYCLDTIATALFKSETEREKFHSHLKLFYNRDDVSRKLQKCDKKLGRVHAEVQLINYFDTHQCQLLDERRPYIGCSKPACYLCYEYIIHHPRPWFLPPSHKKLYRHWCLPDRRGKENRMEFLAATVKTLESQLRDEVRNEQGPRSSHADSTAGATTTISPIDGRYRNIPIRRGLVIGQTKPNRIRSGSARYE